jgi:hypothetical protein
MNAVMLKHLLFLYSVFRKGAAVLGRQDACDTYRRKKGSACSLRHLHFQFPTGFIFRRVARPFIRGENVRESHVLQF